MGNFKTLKVKKLLVYDFLNIFFFSFRKMHYLCININLKRKEKKYEEFRDAAICKNSGK